MVISDFNIVCLGQSAPEFITRKRIGVDIVATKDGYGRHWEILKKSNGMWYQFYPIERETSGQYEDEFFDFIVHDMNYVAIALKNHLVDLKEIVGSYLAMSPIHELLVLIRLDEFGESEKITEITATDFIASLDTGRLLFNHIYHIVQ